jgi:hypothetical protein
MHSLGSYFAVPEGSEACLRGLHDVGRILGCALVRPALSEAHVGDHLLLCADCAEAEAGGHIGGTICVDVEGEEVVGAGWGLVRDGGLGVKRGLARACY